jgi:hypothetical protein
MITPRSCAALALVLAFTAACGDDPDGTTPDADVSARCEPPPPPLPTGPLSDPNAFALPGACVAGGLRDLPGRWFLRSPDGNFSYSYPRYQGDCATGFRDGSREEDHDPGDGYTSHVWSDGTRYFEREYYTFQDKSGATYEYVFGLVACMLPDGTIAALDLYYDTDVGQATFAMTGRRFGPRDEPAAGLALVGSIGAWGTPPAMPVPIHAYNVVVDGTLAYVVGVTGFEVIDVANPEQPAHLGHVDGYYNDVKLTRGNGRVVAYLSPLFDGGTSVVDVTDPAAPAVVAEIPMYSHSVFVAAGAGTPRLYLATYTNEVPVYDVGDPVSPVLLGVAADPGPEAGIHDLYADGDVIYVNNTTAGFVALDVSAGLASPAVERGRFLSNGYSHASWAGAAGGRPIVLHGDEGMTPDGGAQLRVLDGDPASASYLTQVGRYQSRPEVGIHNFQLVGDKVYIAYYQDGVRIVDLADPAQPQEVAHYNTWDTETAPGGAFEGALGIRVANGLIYVADSERGLLILEEP